MRATPSNAIQTIHAQAAHFGVSDFQAEDVPSDANDHPPIPGDRRQQNRRQADRQGKYDRRRNRCEHCLHFAPNVLKPEQEGHCRYHDLPMASDAFACPNFSPLPGKN